MTSSTTQLILSQKIVDKIALEGAAMMKDLRFIQGTVVSKAIMEDSQIGASKSSERSTPNRGGQTVTWW